MNLTESTQSALVKGRFFIFGAMILWSLGGYFTKVIGLPGPVMACYRVVFAGLLLLPFLKPKNISWHPVMILLAIAFSVMNVSFVTAMSLTTSANATFLLYTSPIWVFLGSIFWLKERADRMSMVAFAVSGVGIVIIVASQWKGASLGIGLALLAGFSFGIIGLCMRKLAFRDALWITVMMHLAAAVICFPLFLAIFGTDYFAVTPSQLGWMAIFGILQMGIPYMLYSLGLRYISAQEGLIIALGEPVLNPIIVWFAVQEVPADLTIIGGSFIVMGLLVRYFPRSFRRQK